MIHIRQQVVYFNYYNKINWLDAEFTVNVYKEEDIENSRFGSVPPATLYTITVNESITILNSENLTKIWLNSWLLFYIVELLV